MISKLYLVPFYFKKISIEKPRSYNNLMDFNKSYNQIERFQKNSYHK